MGKYFAKKFFIYLATFFVAVTINWIAPRLMPGDPINIMMGSYRGSSEGAELLRQKLRMTFGLEGNMLQQYLSFWGRLLRGDLGQSITQYPRNVIDIVKKNIVYDIIVLVPAVSLSWIIGNKAGAMAGDNKKVDNYVMPFIYGLISSPYFWFAIIVVFVFSHQLGWFPSAQAHSGGMRPSWSMKFIMDALRHWFLPFFTMFLVTLGQWAIGMRNMIIYEVESNYAQYLRSLGARDRLVRKYAFRNG
ncbi:MAG: ABC transporter permease, partial [Halanaerobiales bacterium]